MSKSTNGLRKAGLASLAVTLTLGAGVMGAGAANSVEGFNFDRIGGENRYETSALVADEYDETNADVILANGEPGSYADALSANYLAGEVDEPILLTRDDVTPDEVLAQLEEDGVKNITVVGGESAVNQSQVDALEAEGYNVERISGSDRFLTNADVIAEGGAATNGIGVIATGFNFPDALAAGPISYQGHPLGLSTQNDIDDEVIAALKGAGVTKVLVMGGVTAVGQAVVDKLEDNGITVLQRFAGADRSDTSELAAEWALKNLGFTDKHLNVASGYTEGYGADALAGGPLTGKQDRPLLITKNVDVPGDVLDYITAHNDTLVDGIIFGGKAAVSVAAEAEMVEAGQGDAPASATSRPELQSATVVDTNTAGELGTDGTTVKYTFDEEIANATTGTPPVEDLFHVYNSSGLVDSGDAIVQVSGNTVTVRFEADTVNTDAEAAALTVATVDFNAVEDPSGAENPEGDAALGSTSGGGSTTLPAGITVAPDLASIGEFSYNAATTSTDVEFTFDEAADVVTPTGFHLISTDEADTVVTSASVVGGAGTTKLIVRFPGNLTRADFARGAVDDGAVTETTDNDGNTKDDNVAQAADISNGGNSGDPDLVSVQLVEGSTTAGDQAVFTFDENIESVDTVAGFHLYYADAETLVNGLDYEINTADRRQVAVDFAEGDIDGAVGGQVDADSVTAADANSNKNQFDEVGVANTSTSPVRTSGRTDGPDLTGVSVETRTNSFGVTTGADVTYTFDEAVQSAVDTKFFVYLADGTKDTADLLGCEVNDNGTVAASDDTSVTCEFTADAPTTAAQLAAAVLGTVDNGAVTAVSGTPNTNPEGAERVS